MASELTTYRILVVDDHQDTATLLSAVLRTLGADVLTSYNGPQAVESCEAFAPCVVLLDLGMPGMDGFAVAKKIRSLPNGSTTRIIAVTGWVQEQARDLSSEFGIDQFLLKPVDVRELVAVIQAESPNKS